MSFAQAEAAQTTSAAAAVSQGGPHPISTVKPRPNSHADCSPELLIWRVSEAATQILQGMERLVQAIHAMLAALTVRLAS